MKNSSHAHSSLVDKAKELPSHIGKKTVGGSAGALVGAIVGGPIGAAVGGAIGAAFGAAAQYEPPKAAGRRTKKVARNAVAQVKTTAKKVAAKTVAKAHQVKGKAHKVAVKAKRIPAAQALKRAKAKA